MVKIVISRSADCQLLMTSNVVAKNSLMWGKFTQMVKILPGVKFFKVHMNTLITPDHCSFVQPYF